MKHATYINAIRSHIESGFALHDALKNFAPIWNDMDKGEQLAFRDDLVKLIALKKGIKYKLAEKGALKGHPTFERGSAGLSMVNYYMPKAVVEKTSTTRKQVDEIAAYAKRIQGKLSKAQIKRLVALLAA